MGFDPPRYKWLAFNWMGSGCSTSKPPRLDYHHLLFVLENFEWNKYLTSKMDFRRSECFKNNFILTQYKNAILLANRHKQYCKKILQNDIRYFFLYSFIHLLKLGSYSDDWENRFKPARAITQNVYTNVSSTKEIQV